MFVFRKNIILVPTDFDGMSFVKGLLTLDIGTTKTECTLRTYNLEIEKPILLGIAINGRLNKIEVKPKDIKNFNFVLDEAIKNTDNIACVLIDLKKSSYDILLWGSTEINEAWKTSLSLLLDDTFNERVNETKSQNNIANQSFEYDSKGADDFENCENLNCDSDTASHQKDFEYDLNNDESKFEEDIDKSSFHSFDDQFESTNQANNDVNIEYNNVENDFVDDVGDKAEIYTYEDEKINAFIDKVIDMTESPKENVKSNPEDMTFYERINYQIDKMFAQNREETVLNEILPNSKFCRVEFEDKSGYYVFGIIYDNGIPKYLCYGVPAKYGDTPPTELSNLYQWLPLNTNDEFGDGYYMMYQDANTGKNISVEII